MKGLLLKDWYMIKKYMRSYLLLLFIFVAVSFADSNNTFFVYYPCLISGMIPTSLLAYDERSKWDLYAGTLPCTRAQIVSAKYLLGALLLAVVLITAVVQGFHMAGGDEGEWTGYLMLLQMLLILGCVTSSITLPFMFKFGVEKGRAAYYVMIGVVCGGSVMASSLFREAMQMGITYGLTLPLLCLAAMGLYALSWYLSIRFYEKRELK